jgi:hypothetical protein
MLRLFKWTVNTRRGNLQDIRSLYNVMSVEKLAELAADPPQIVDVRTAFLVQVKP